jgi:acetyl esterase/lipase
MWMHEWLRRVCFLFLPVGLFLAGSCGGVLISAASEPSDKSKASEELSRPIRVQRNLEFRSVAGESVKADFYRPDDESLVPLVVMIHGGGWSAGDKWELQDHAREMAQAGFAAVTINYRLAPKHQMADQVDDCRQALRWASENAEEWGADSTRVCLWGYSAGAHLAALLATDPQPGDPKLCAVVAGGAPCEFSFIPSESSAIAHVMGGTRDEKPRAYENASPLTHASQDDSPFFFFHGTADLIVPQASSQYLHSKLCELNVESEYYAVEGRGHLLAFIDRTARRRAIDFLRKHTTKENDAVK